MFLQIMCISFVLMLMGMWFSYRILADEPAPVRETAVNSATAEKIAVTLRRTNAY